MKYIFWSSYEIRMFGWLGLLFYITKNYIISCNQKTEILLMLFDITKTLDLFNYQTVVIFFFSNHFRKKISCNNAEFDGVNYNCKHSLKDQELGSRYLGNQREVFGSTCYENLGKNWEIVLLQICRFLSLLWPKKLKLILLFYMTAWCTWNFDYAYLFINPLK